MHIDPYLIASTVEVVIGQRLVRKRCSRCTEGCSSCNFSGFKGRTGIYEVMVMNEQLRDLVMQKAPAHILQQRAVQHGMTLLSEDGLHKVKQGLTSIDELRYTLS
jgi:general secretion pathway protein E